MYYDLTTGLGAPVAKAEECIPSIDVPTENRQRMIEFLERKHHVRWQAKKGDHFISGTSRLAIQKKASSKHWKPQYWAHS